MATLKFLDGLNNADLEVVAQAAFRIIETLQDSKSHVQAAATAAAFLILCDRYRIEPQEVFRVAQKMLLDDVNGGRFEFRAMRLYAQHELKD